MSLNNLDNIDPDKVDKKAKNMTVSSSAVLIPTKKNPIKIHPDSPRTLEACNELGIEPDYFKLKTLEGFAGPHVPEKIQKIRFSHYMGRVTQTAIEVLRRRREILRRELISQQIASPLPDERQDRNPSGLLMKSTVDFPQKSSIMRASSGLKRSLPQNVARTFNHTLSYFRNSHDSPLVRKREKPDTAEEKGIEYHLTEEIEKFNKLKLQKQREAKFIYEEETRRLKVLEELKAKEKRMEAYHKTQRLKKELKKEERRKEALEKIEQIKEIERKFLESKKEERLKIKKRNDELRNKRQRELEESERVKLELKNRYQQKQTLIKQKISQKIQEEDERTLERFEELNKRIETSEKSYEGHLRDIVSRKREMSLKERSTFERSVQIKGETEQQIVSSVVEKLIKQERSKELIFERKRKQDSERRQTVEEKNLHFSEVKRRIKDDDKEKLRDIKDKLQKIESNLELKRKHEMEQIKMKQEFRRLKERDKLENYERNKRQNTYKLQKLLEKEKLIEEKLNQRKLEEDILKKAKMESALHSKIEKDRIFDGIKQVTNILTTQKPNQQVLLSRFDKEKGLKVLKAILNEQEVDMEIFREPIKQEETIPGVISIDKEKEKPKANK